MHSIFFSNTHHDVITSSVGGLVQKKKKIEYSEDDFGIGT